MRGGVLIKHTYKSIFRRSGTFYQIRDIYKLRNRIATSHHYLTMDTERQLLDLLLETSIHTQVHREVTKLGLLRWLRGVESRFAHIVGILLYFIVKNINFMSLLETMNPKYKKAIFLIFNLRK